MLKAIGCKVTALNAQPDGYFPARKSEPTAESLRDLANVVKALGADIGIAFDGDGDRVAFVDEKGVFVNFDRSLAAYAAYALKQSGGGTVVTNVEASMCVETMAQTQGGKVIRTKSWRHLYFRSHQTVGRSFRRRTMWRMGASPKSLLP